MDIKTYYTKICQEFFIIILIGYKTFNNKLTLIIQNYRKNNDKIYNIFFDTRCDANYNHAKH